LQLYLILTNNFFQFNRCCLHIAKQIITTEKRKEIEKAWQICAGRGLGKALSLIEQLYDEQVYFCNKNPSPIFLLSCFISMIRNNN